MNSTNTSPSSFFHRNWWLYYLLFFLLLGLLIYALLWNVGRQDSVTRIQSISNQLAECQQDNIANNTVPVYNTVNCDQEVNSGGQGFTRSRHELGNISGQVKIDYDMRTVPDQIKVFYEGNLVAGTPGVVSGENSVVWYYRAGKNKPTYCIVEMSAPQEGTAWTYSVGCPTIGIK